MVSIQERVMMVPVRFAKIAIWQKFCFGQFYYSRIEVLQIAELLAPVIFS
jgi:hypothetical protein